MARYFGEIGYGRSKEDPPGSGKWVDEITTRKYRGDIVRNIRKLDPSDKVNSDITFQNQVSILADPYAFENFMYIKYVSWSGTLWTVTSVEEKSPRLILSLGSVYNGPTP